MWLDFYVSGEGKERCVMLYSGSGPVQSELRGTRKRSNLLRLCDLWCSPFSTRHIFAINLEKSDLS